MNSLSTNHIFLFIFLKPVFTGLIVNITLVTLGVAGSLIPTGVLFLSCANEADSILFPSRCPFSNHPYFPNCCLHHSLQSVIGKRAVGNNDLPSLSIFYKADSLKWSPTLLFSLWFLLILSGDIEVNPGPQGIVQMTKMLTSICTVHTYIDYTSLILSSSSVM